MALPIARLAREIAEARAELPLARDLAARKAIQKRIADLDPKRTLEIEGMRR